MRTRKYKGCAYFRNLDSNTKALFMSNCMKAGKGYTMQNVLERLMTHYVKYPETVLIPNPPKLHGKGVLFVRCLREDIYRDFRAMCRQRSKKYYMVIEGLMRAYNADPAKYKLHNFLERRRPETRMRKEDEQDE